MSQRRMLHSRSWSVCGLLQRYLKNKWSDWLIRLATHRRYRYDQTKRIYKDNWQKEKYLQASLRGVCSLRKNWDYYFNYEPCRGNFCLRRFISGNFGGVYFSIKTNSFRIGYILYFFFIFSFLYFSLKIGNLGRIQWYY